MKYLLASSVLAASVLALQAAEAATTCTVSTTGVAFGTYDVFSTAPLDSTGTIMCSCDKKGDIRIELGTGSSGTYNPRQLFQGSEALTYNLYLEAARTTIWGNGTGGTGFYFQANVPKNTPVNVTVYGRIPAGQDVSAGSYADDVIVTTILF